jgi:hypothetical protein
MSAQDEKNTNKEGEIPSEAVRNVRHFDNILMA